MTGKEFVDKARSFLGLKTVYKLGASTPGKSCDCTGFLAAALGVSRKIEGIPEYVKVNGGWLETKGLYEDAISTWGFITYVNFARVGNLMLWGDHKGRQGHVGIITEADPEGNPIKVIHCSSGNYRKLGNAIAETGPEIFWSNRAIIAKIKWIEDT